MEVKKISLKSLLNAKQELHDSFVNTGFAILTDLEGFMDYTLVEKAYQEWEAFFNLPEEEKALYKFDPEIQGGWFPFGSEKAKDATVKDLKEFYHYYPNKGVHPNLIHTPELFSVLEDLAVRILSLLQEVTPFSVIKGPDYFPLMIDGSNQTLLRPIYYPALNAVDAEPGAVRAAAHEDINLITLLPAATAEGLEVKDVEGRWHKVPIEPGSIIVNVGDMLQRHTGGYYPSTTHRVVNPEDPTKPRLSMPLFLHPRSNCFLDETTTAGEYLEQRLKELGLK